MTSILDSLAEGANRDEILNSYPSLEAQHIDAAVAYAAELAPRRNSLALVRPMKFKVDENLPSEVVADIRAAGHDADSVFDEGLNGAPDSTIMARIQSEGRAILTLDKGIADVRVYPPDQYAGLILLRPRTTGRAATLAFVRKHLTTLLQATLSGHLFVVSDTGIRIR